MALFSDMSKGVGYGQNDVIGPISTNAPLPRAIRVTSDFRVVFPLLPLKPFLLVPISQGLSLFALPFCSYKGACLDVCAPLSVSFSGGGIFIKGLASELRQ